MPPPSNLPNLLIATFRLLLMLTGISTIALAVYFTRIFPRLAASFGVRSNLRLHQLSLLERFTTRLQELKYTQDESLAWLKPSKKLVTGSHAEPPDQPAAETASGKPALQGKEEVQSPVNPVNPVLPSLEKLLESIPPSRKPQFASTLRDMTDVTGFITSHMYAPNVPSVAEAEMRKEIRAAKGLFDKAVAPTGGHLCHERRCDVRFQTVCRSPRSGRGINWVVDFRSMERVFGSGSGWMVGCYRAPFNRRGRQANEDWQIAAGLAPTCLWY